MELEYVTFKNIPPSKPTRRKTEIIEKTRKNCCYEK